MMQQASIEILWFIQVFGSFLRNFCLESFALKSISGQLDISLCDFELAISSLGSTNWALKIKNPLEWLEPNHFLWNSSRFLSIKIYIFDPANIHLWNFGRQSGQDLVDSTLSIWIDYSSKSWKLVELEPKCIWDYWPPSKDEQNDVPNLC
jgi:hypothetical protein